MITCFAQALHNSTSEITTRKSINCIHFNPALYIRQWKLQICLVKNFHFFTQITTENSFLFIYHHSFWNDISFLLLAIHVYMRARIYLQKSFSRDFFHLVSTRRRNKAFSLLWPKKYCDLDISWSTKCCDLDIWWSVKYCDFEILLWNDMASKSCGSRSIVAYRS